MGAWFLAKLVVRNGIAVQPPKPGYLSLESIIWMVRRDDASTFVTMRDGSDFVIEQSLDIVRRMVEQ